MRKSGLNRRPATARISVPDHADEFPARVLPPPRELPYHLLTVACFPMPDSCAMQLPEAVIVSPDR